MEQHLEDFSEYIKVATEAIILYGPKLLLAIITLFLGWKLINLFERLIEKALSRAGVDPTIRPYIDSLLVWLLRIILLISVASMVGINTTSLVAVLGAIGLAIGLAMQGTLTNFAGGLLILTFHPFRHNHLIEVEDILGYVKEIKLFYTRILTLNNKEVIMPNAKLSNEVVINWSVRGKLRLDLTVGIAYESDIPQAKEVLTKAVKANGYVLDDPEPLIGVRELADSSVNMVLRPWCNPDDYFKATFSIIEDCKLALDANDITIPFPQRDLHIFPDQGFMQLKDTINKDE